MLIHALVDYETDKTEITMNFDDAIRAHSDWKGKLASYIQKPDKTLKCDVVSRDNECALGKWIYGEGARLSHVPEFQKMKEAHIRFHIAAGDVIRRADKGENASADLVLGGTSPYARASTDVVGCLMALKRQAT